MTIKKLAEELKVSPQAVYQRLKNNKVDVRKLVDYKTRELTADGEYAIRKLFSKEDGEQKPTKQSIIEEFTKQIESLKDELAAKDEKLKAVETERDKLAVDKENITKALFQAQELHQKALDKFLPAAGQTAATEQPRKLTWKERFTGRTGSK